MFEGEIIMDSYSRLLALTGILLVLLIFCISTKVANGQSSSLNLQLPNASGNYQSDSFRTGDLDCSMAIGSATNLEFGVTGIINNGYMNSYGAYVHGQRVGDIGLYARIIIPLGATPGSRIDCNRLYELELQKQSLELMRLEAEVRRLRALQFEN